MVERPRPITARPRTQASSGRAYNAAEVGMDCGEAASPRSAKGTSAVGGLWAYRVAREGLLSAHLRRTLTGAERQT